MAFIYNIVISIYYFLIVISSLFNKKARTWLSGRKDLFKKLENSLGKNEKIVWFHCASLGEFEQGRPVIEAIKNQNPDHKILISFFSPSGYEIRKNYRFADYVYYLPLDFKKNSRKFIDLVNPQIAIFVKYEFWYNYLKILKEKNIPLYIISAIFRKNQSFFKWYGGWYRNLLRYPTHLFVQDGNSKDLLSSINIQNVTIAGDTRFDRVNTFVENSQNLPLIEKFSGNDLTIVAGSTWERDEEVLISYINFSNEDIKLIIAPHEIHQVRISRVIKQINKKSIRLSEADENNIKENNVLIIDSVGILASVYKYADMAYIGGGFGKGIHNILEAAAYGIPVLFGPNFKKFREAVELLQQKGAFFINNDSELRECVDKLLSDKKSRQEAGQISRDYIKSNLGATGKILNKITEKLD